MSVGTEREFDACVLAISPEALAEQELLVRVEESPWMHSAFLPLVGAELTLVVDRETEIAWLGDSEFCVGGIVTVIPAKGEDLRPGGRVPVDEMTLQNFKGEVFRP